MAFTQPCVATLLLLLRVVYLAIVVHCQQPFSVSVSSRAGQRNNLVTLQCVQNDGTGVQNAVFYRNGVSQREDVCLSTGMALSGGQYRLMLGPACEGHYMCGIEGNMGRTAQLSGPKKIYAFPQLLPENRTGNLNLISREGENVTLPCSIERSALNQFMINWRNGDLQVAEGLISSEDYSLTLVNVMTQASGRYFCSATSQQLLIGQNRILNGRTVTLRVIRRPIPPRFTKPLIYTMDDMGRTVFSVTAEGSETLDIRWFINNQLVNNSNIQSQNAGPNQRQSRLFLQQTPRVNSTITAVVSDMDEFTKEQFSARMLVLVISQAQIGQNTTTMQDAIIIFLTVLCTLLFIFLIIGILLVVFLVKNKGSFTKGKDGSSTESLMRMEQQRESTPDTSPTADPKPDANPTPDPTPDSTPNSTPNSTPDPTSEQPNPIADILVHVGKYLQNKAETELDLCVLEGLDTVVTRILNQEVENLTNDAYNCIEKVQSLLELAQRNIRQQRRPQRREVVASVVLAEKIERVEVDGSDSGITSIGLADREDIIEGVDGGAEQDDVEGEEFRKIARIYSNVTRWLNSCREYKRQNAIEAQNSTASSVEIT